MATRLRGHSEDVDTGSGTSLVSTGQCNVYDLVSLGQFHTNGDMSVGNKWSIRQAKAPSLPVRRHNSGYVFILVIHM